MAQWSATLGCDIVEEKEVRNAAVEWKELSDEEAAAAEVTGRSRPSSSEYDGMLAAVKAGKKVTVPFNGIAPKVEAPRGGQESGISDRPGNPQGRFRRSGQLAAGEAGRTSNPSADRKQTATRRPIRDEAQGFVTIARFRAAVSILPPFIYAPGTYWGRRKRTIREIMP